MGLELADLLRKINVQVTIVQLISRFMDRQLDQLGSEITATAEQQADTIAKYIAGDWASYYQGSLSVNIMKIQGVQLCSMGMIEIPKSSDYEEITFIDKAKRYYKKCIIHNDKLVGAILIGDKSEFLKFKDLIAKGIELSDKRLEILRSGKKADPVMGKLICSCNNVGEENLKTFI